MKTISFAFSSSQMFFSLDKSQNTIKNFVLDGSNHIITFYFKNYTSSSPTFPRRLHDPEAGFRYHPRPQSRRTVIRPTLNRFVNCGYRRFFSILMLFISLLTNQSIRRINSKIVLYHLHYHFYLLLNLNSTLFSFFVELTEIKYYLLRKG